MSVKLRTPYVITLLDAGSAPASTAGVVKLYALDTGGGNVELFVKDAAGNDSQVTDGGTITAGGLLDASGVVDVSAATAPTTGQVLTATSSSAATWQTPATSLALTSSAPVAVDAGSASLGVSTDAAKGDHKHSVTTAGPTAITVGGSNVTGVSSSLARADHVHSLPAFGSTAGTFAQGNDSRLSDDRTASGLRSATTIVSVSSATAPTAGQALVATSTTAATWQTPSATAISLATTGAAVVVNTASPPSSGQVLTALGATSANWQTPTGGGGGGGSSFLTYGFDLTRGNTDSTTADEIANTLFNSTGLTGVVRIVAVLECAAAGQTCSLELYNNTDGATVTTITTTNTTSTRVSSAVLSLAGGEKLYGVRLSRTGGSASDRVTCRLARFENTAV